MGYRSIQLPVLERYPNSTDRESACYRVLSLERYLEELKASILVRKRMPFNF
jgi:hypothetical protein